MERYESIRGKNLGCAICRCSSRTATLVKVAEKSCPEGWTKEYEGHLMAPGKGTKGEFICVDKDMHEPDGQPAFGGTDNIQNVKEATVSCGSLPCKPYEEMKPIECVVCTI